VVWIWEGSAQKRSWRRPLTTSKNGGRTYWYKNLASISLTYMKLRQLVRLATSVKRKPFHRG